MIKTGELKSGSNTPRVLLFIGLSIVSIAVILLLTVNDQTIKTLATFSTANLCMLVGVWFCLVMSDSLSMMAFTRGTGEKLSLIKAIKVVTIRTFFNVITPFTAGGQPVIIFALTHEKVPAGKASSIIITKVLTFAIFYQTGAALAFVLLFNNYRDNIAVSIFFGIAGTLYMTLIILMVLALLSQSFLIAFVRISAKVLFKLRIVKDMDIYKKAAIRETHLARKSFRQFFRKHKISFFIGSFFNGIMYICQVLLLYFVLRSLGVEISIWTGFMLSALILFLIAFAPTPGSAGLGEIVFVLILKNAVEPYILGIAVIIWRFFYQYLNAIIGAISSSTIMSKMLVKIKKRTKKANPVKEEG
ncbi:MAG: flippase-like domain-containing protein [Spirochaetales bacterium]|nr:flippase-like domain-containing protein [Spirochaetales bacterium]